MCAAVIEMKKKKKKMKKREEKKKKKKKKKKEGNKSLETQLQKSVPLGEVTNFTKELDAYTDDIKTWMTENHFFLETFHRFPP